MKSIRHELFIAADRFDPCAAEIPAVHHQPGVASVCLPDDGLSADQVERRDDLLDRGLPFTWRCPIDGARAIVREHPDGRLEQMEMAGNGKLLVTRVLRASMHPRH